MADANSVNLLEYLPPFLREYREMKAVMNAENPELSALYENADRVLNNEFIATADEYGIERFEKLLGVLPSKSDTLESRRARVLSRWFTQLPYTLRAFLAKLYGLSDYGNIEVAVDFDRYRIAIDTDFELYGQTSEIERLVELMFPCNIIADLRNTMRLSAHGKYTHSGTVGFTETAVLSGDTLSHVSVEGGSTGGGMQFTQTIQA